MRNLLTCEVVSNLFGRIDVCGGIQVWFALREKADNRYQLVEVFRENSWLVTGGNIEAMMEEAGTYHCLNGVHW
jgi:hypothetical protein